MQGARSFGFQELCTPNAELKKTAFDDFNFSAKHFVKQRVGAVTDSYIIKEQLGKGGFGEVFACVHKDTGIERAVKILPRVNREGGPTDEEVLKEFNILKELDHPNILRQIEMFFDDDYYYLVTEISRGGELFQQIAEWGFLVEEDAVEIIRHLLMSVNYCHKNGVVHRDLKPENILLEEDKDVDSIKVIDFGLAQVVHGLDQEMHDIAGSIYYISPEVFEGSHTSKADIWSVGVIAYVLLAGYPPFDGDDDEEIEEAICSGEFEFETEIWDTVTDQSKDFITTLLEMDPNERPSAEEALNHPWLVEGRRANLERLNQRDSVQRRAMETLYNLERFYAQNKLKQATCSFIASQLVLKEEREKIDEIFRALDINSDGKLSKEDVRSGYKEVFGKELTEEMVDKMFEQIDTDKTGYIEYSEFVIATMSEKDLLTTDKLKHAFNLFDADGSGRIDCEELVEVLSYFQAVDKTLDSEAIARIVNTVDKDGDGMISFDEFVAMMFKTTMDDSEKTEVGQKALPQQQGKKPRKRSTVKSCIQLFERKIVDAKEFVTKPLARRDSAGGALKRLSSRLCFGKVQTRDSEVIIRRAPSPSPFGWSSSHHSRNASLGGSLRGSSAENRPASAKARIALIEELGENYLQDDSFADHLDASNSSHWGT